MVNWSFNTEVFDKLMWSCKFGILYFSKMARLLQSDLVPTEEQSLFSTILWLLLSVWYSNYHTVRSPSYPEGQQVGALLNSSSRTANHMDWVIQSVSLSDYFNPIENLTKTAWACPRMNCQLRPSTYRNLSNNSIIQF